MGVETGPASFEAFAAEAPAASLDDIAGRAGVGAGTVHHHFPTKDELLVAVLAERLQDLAEAVGALAIERQLTEGHAASA